MPGFGHDTKEGFQYVEGNNWWLYIRHKLEDLETPCSEILDTNLLKKCIAYYNEVLSRHQEVDGPCVVQMDFRPGNILVLNESKISGLIDFESAHGGPSEIDFIKIKQYVWDVYHIGIQKHPDLAKFRNFSTFLFFLPRI